MKYLAFSLYFTLQFAAKNFAQNVSGARMAALSGSAIAQSDAFTGFNNLSASAQMKGLSCAFYGQMPYSISEIKDAGVSILQHLGTGVMGVVFRSYGSGRIAQTNRCIEFI